MALPLLSPPSLAAPGVLEFAAGGEVTLFRAWRRGWPLRILAWKALHHVVNGLAWRFARPPGPDWGVANRIDRRHPLWRLNDWVADHWSGWWIENHRRLR